jgi:hypothetical protein
MLARFRGEHGHDLGRATNRTKLADNGGMTLAGFDRMIGRDRSGVAGA